MQLEGGFGGMQLKIDMNLTEVDPLTIAERERASKKFFSVLQPHRPI
jgi:hypothetical protein